MKHLRFPQVEFSLLSGNPGEALVVRSARTLLTLSSAIVGGGFGHTRTIINRHVDRDYDVREAALDLIAFARKHGIEGTFVGLMTAVYLDQACAATCIENDLRVAAIATVGLGNRIAAGLTEPAPPGPGTINLIVLVDGHLTPAAMVNAVATATEAKSQVLREREICTVEGYGATGTSTDATVIACTGRGAAHRYAGPATWVGWCIARSVRGAMLKTFQGGEENAKL